jgi:hypothetical protein
VISFLFCMLLANLSLHAAGYGLFFYSPSSKLYHSYAIVLYTRIYTLYTCIIFLYILLCTALAMNTAYNEAIKSTPFMLNYGQNPETPIALYLRKSNPLVNKLVGEWSEQLQCAKHCLQAAQDRQRIRANRKRPPVEPLKVGDQLLSCACIIDFPPSKVTCWPATHQLDPNLTRASSNHFPVMIGVAETLDVMKQSSCKCYSVPGVAVTQCASNHYARSRTSKQELFSPSLVLTFP